MAWMWFSRGLAYCESTDHMNGVLSVCIDCAHARNKDLGSMEPMRICGAVLWVDVGAPQKAAQGKAY